MGGDTFLEAPLPPDDFATLKKTESRLEIRTSLSHGEVLSFYKKALEGEKDIKYRDWKDETYIEDDGNRPWHSVRLSKGDRQGTLVTIVKDNWTWIIGTLLLRYVGVFVVLIILFAGMSISGAVISWSVKRAEARTKESAS